MSATTSSGDTAECVECGGERDIYDSVEGSYCSEECYYRHKGVKALNTIREDHRFCGTCGGSLKEISPPTEDWKHENGSQTQVALKHGAEYHNVDDIGLALDATECYRANPTSVDSVIGYQYRTPKAVTVFKEVEGPDEYTRKETTTTGCICGCTDLSDTDDTLRECQPARVLANYFRTLRHLERDGPVNEKIDKDVFFETYRETRDFDLAVGRALYE